MARFVVDSNLLIALGTGDPRADAVSNAVNDWLASGGELHAPELARYEIASGLVRLVGAGRISGDQAREVWSEIAGLPITFHPLREGGRTIEIATLLERSSAYDASYLALAEDLEAQLWTLDGPLARNAVSRGFEIHLLPAG